MKIRSWPFAWPAATCMYARRSAAHVEIQHNGAVKKSKKSTTHWNRHRLPNEPNSWHAAAIYVHIALSTTWNVHGHSIDVIHLIAILHTLRLRFAVHFLLFSIFFLSNQIWRWHILDGVSILTTFARKNWNIFKQQRRFADQMAIRTSHSRHCCALVIEWIKVSNNEMKWAAISIDENTVGECIIQTIVFTNKRIKIRRAFATLSI